MAVGKNKVRLFSKYFNSILHGFNFLSISLSKILTFDQIYTTKFLIYVKLCKNFHFGIGTNHQCETKCYENRIFFYFVVALTDSKHFYGYRVWPRLAKKVLRRRSSILSPVKIGMTSKHHPSSRSVMSARLWLTVPKVPNWPPMAWKAESTKFRWLIYKTRR